MRTKNGKRIGPVPIAVVAVFALAALLSAGLLVLIPSSTQAQTATVSLPDLTLDVGEAGEITAAQVAAAFGFDVDNVEDYTITIASDQDEPETSVDLPATVGGDEVADGNGQIETNNSGSDDRVDAISVSGGVITIPANFVLQPLAEQADNTARITVKATETTPNTELTPVRFDLKIVQNPFQEDGDNAVNPNTWVTDATSSDCAVESDTDTDLESRGLDITAGTTGTNTTGDHDVLISGGACTTVGNSVDVALRNTTANTVDDREITYLVYVTGGSSFSKVDGYPGKSGLNEELHRKLEKTDELGDPGEGTITVSRSMADKAGGVYLYGYLGALADKRLKSTSEAFEADADFVVQVQFVDGPALAFDASREDTAFDATLTADDDVNGSTLRAAEPAEAAAAQDKDKDGYHDGMYMIPSGSDAEIRVTATIMDANGNPLNAGDKDSRVDFSVMYVEGSDISDSADDYSSRKVMKKGSHTAFIDVDGWNDSDKAVKVTVSATYTSPMAPDGFDLGTVTLTRVADLPSAADFATYSCVGDEDQSTAAKGCDAEYKATADTRFGPQDYFVVYGKFEDSLGSVTEDSPELELSAAAKEALDVSVRAAMGYSARASSGSVLVQVKEDVELGEYTLTVTNGRSGDDEVTQELTVSIAGPPVKYTVDPMGTHHTTSRRVTFTVAALDESDGVPNFTEDDPETDANESNMVQIDAIDGDVRGTKVTPDDVLALNTGTGMGTFTYTLPRNVMADEEFDIFVGEGAMQVSVTVVFGEAPPEETVPGMPMNVMAMADDAMYNTINVTWDSPESDGNSDITGYMVQSAYMMSDGMMSDWMDVDPAHMGMDMMYADMGLMAETKYYYRVAAMNAEGMGEYSDGMAYAMTGMEPPMELMAPMNVGAGLNSGGTVVVTWDAVEGAAGYVVIAIDTSSFEAKSAVVNRPDATSGGVSGLTRGATYNIFVASFNGETPEGVLSTPIMVTAN